MKIKTKLTEENFSQYVFNQKLKPSKVMLKNIKSNSLYVHIDKKKNEWYLVDEDGFYDRAFISESNITINNDDLIYCIGEYITTITTDHEIAPYDFLMFAKDQFIKNLKSKNSKQDIENLLNVLKQSITHFAENIHHSDKKPLLMLSLYSFLADFEESLLTKMFYDESDDIAVSGVQLAEFEKFTMNVLTDKVTVHILLKLFDDNFNELSTKNRKLFSYYWKILKLAHVKNKEKVENYISQNSDFELYFEYFLEICDKCELVKFMIDLYGGKYRLNHIDKYADSEEFDFELDDYTTFKRNIFNNVFSKNIPIKIDYKFIPERLADIEFILQLHYIGSIELFNNDHSDSSAINPKFKNDNFEQDIDHQQFTRIFKSLRTDDDLIKYKLLNELHIINEECLGKKEAYDYNFITTLGLYIGEEELEKLFRTLGNEKQTYYKAFYEECKYKIQLSNF